MPEGSGSCAPAVPASVPCAPLRGGRVEAGALHLHCHHRGRLRWPCPARSRSTAARTDIDTLLPSAGRPCLVDSSLNRDGRRARPWRPRPAGAASNPATDDGLHATRGRPCRRRRHGPGTGRISTARPAAARTLPAADADGDERPAGVHTVRHHMPEWRRAGHMHGTRRVPRACYIML